ncbi:MAG: FAD-dependent oxidoreductase, partial [Acidimicrobiales bacterium]
MPIRFVVIGGGPAGVEAASTAARFGAEVVVVERDVFGGAANLWDCIPSKAMIATGEVLSIARRSVALGLSLGDDPPDLEVLRERLHTISDHLSRSTASQLEAQGVRIVRGVGRLVGPHDVEIAPSQDGGATGRESLTADAVLLATGSTPRVPDWA